MSANETRLINYLYNLGIKNISEQEKEKLFSMYANRQDFGMIEKELDLLYALNKILIGTYSKVCLNNMIKISNDIDDDMVMNLFFLYENIKRRGFKGVDCLSEFSKASYQILKNNKKTNLIVKKILFDEFNKVESIKNVLYFGMLDKEKADKLFDNCLKRSKLFLSQCDSKNLLTIINCLKNNFNFSDDELVEVSSKCATFFAFSSANKITNLEKTINDFKMFIFQGLVEMKASKKVYKLLDKNFKDILLNSATIASSNSKFVNDTIKFLMGESVGAITNDYTTSACLIRGNFTPAQLAKIYNNSITSLSMGVDKISDVCMNVASIYKRYYSNELDLTKLINGRNFTGIEQLTKDDYDYQKSNKITQIFDLLTPFFDGNEFEKLLQNNLSFLIATEDEVKIALKEAILSSKDSKELKKNILHKIKNHFDRYQNQFSDIQRDEGVVVDSANKVSLKDLNEDNIVDFLSNIKVIPEEIEKWKEEWNKETRELKIVELEVNLENILSQLNDLEELIPFSYPTLEAFNEETSLVRNLLIDLVNNYKSLQLIKPMTKNVKELVKSINTKIENVKEKIDNNYDLLISSYKQQLAGLNDNLSQVNSKIIKHRNDLSKLDEVTLELLSYQEKGMSLEELDKMLKHAEDSITALQDIRKKSKEYDKLGKEYMNRFSDELDVDKSFQNNEHIFIHDRYKNSNYMRILFVNALINSGLVERTELSMKLYSVIDEEDKNKDYQEFRKLLSYRLVSFGDKIVEYYTKSMDLDTVERKKIIMNSINFFNLEYTEEETIKELSKKLDDYVNGIDEIHTKVVKLTRQKENISNNNQQEVIDGLIEELERLTNNISLVNKSIEELDDKKFTKR